MKEERRKETLTLISCYPASFWYHHSQNSKTNKDQAHQSGEIKRQRAKEATQRKKQKNEGNNTDPVNDGLVCDA
jgi:hypothetical protein